MNLVEGILSELNRCRELPLIYDAIGPAGAFGKAMIEAAITEGEAAMGSGDTIRMIKACQALKECKS